MKEIKFLCLASLAFAVLGTMYVFIPNDFVPKVQLNTTFKMDDKELKVKDKLKRALDKAKDIEDRL